jgi:hypothetical protein
MPTEIKSKDYDYIYHSDELYLDTTEFADYADTVKKVMQKLGPATLRAIKTELADKHIEKFNLLNVFERIGVEHSWVLPTRYSVASVARMSSHFNNKFVKEVVS